MLRHRSVGFKSISEALKPVSLLVPSIVIAYISDILNFVADCEGIPGDYNLCVERKILTESEVSRRIDSPTKVKPCVHSIFASMKSHANYYGF